MNSFAIARPRSFDEASNLVKSDRYSLPILKAGGMDVVDHLKEGIYEPDALVDIRLLRTARNRNGIGVAGESNAFVVEATATLANIARSDQVRKLAPVVSQACESAATPQVRNVATAAGNLLQRNRCWYYRNSQFECLVRGGADCSARNGENAYHAIFDGGPCHSVHPSNLALAMAVCGGMVHVIGGDRETIDITSLYRMPDNARGDFHVLRKGEIVTQLTINAAPRSGFYSIKEKQSFDWPLVMAGVSFDLDGDTIANARVVAGAVAPLPRPLPNVARALERVNVEDDRRLREVCGRSSEGARPLSDNAYKLKLLPVAIHRAILKAAGREVPA